MKRGRIFLLFIFPIFLYSSQLEILNLARDVKLYEKNEWKALLHYNNGLNIKDKKFIISKKFSLQNELYMTIEGFYISKENKLFDDSDFIYLHSKAADLEGC